MQSQKEMFLGFRKDRTIAALVPAKQEAKFIYEVVRRSLPYVDKVLVVDDGSTDQTVSEAIRAGAEVFRHPVSLGKGRALQSGLKHLSGYAHVIMLDGDLQHVPEEIERFVDEIALNDAAMIIGTRSFDKKTMPLLRRFTNSLMSNVISLLCGQRIADTQCGFRSVRSDVIEVLLGACRTVGYDFESEMLLLASRLGFRIRTVPVTTCYGLEVSKIRPLRDTIRFILLVLRYLVPQPHRTGGYSTVDFEELNYPSKVHPESDV
ncbi:glycosyltransferase family 2 protein [soil metagenome]